ncbi:MAG: ribosome maturation factor RimM [Pyrinomonadaceae bacterium]
MDLVAIARIVRTRGLRGELVADLLTDFPERFDNLARVFAVGEKGGDPEELEIEDFWFQKGRVILKFRGVDSIEAAEPLRNQEICVPEDEAVELEESEFFDWQLEGCEVSTIEGERIGHVREIMRTGGTELLVVEDADDPKKDYLIPFAEAICPEVDIENKRIKIDPPEGLLEF